MIALRPRNNWSVDGNTLIWQDDIVLKPTPEEIEQKKQELIAGLPMKRLRYERDLLLRRCDKYSLPDWPHSDSSKRQEWLDYRQALRDLPNNTTPQFDSNNNLINVTWPIKPDTETTTTTEETTTTTEDAETTEETTTTTEDETTEETTTTTDAETTTETTDAETTTETTPETTTETTEAETTTETTEAETTTTTDAETTTETTEAETTTETTEAETTTTNEETTN